MRNLLVGITCTVLLAPCVTLAQSLPAGFAPGSIWLSETQIASGDTVHIFTVVYNSSNNSIQGDVAFSVDESVVGTADFTLSPGESDVESQPWVASAGTHSFSAVVENVRDSSTNQPIVIENTTTDSISATVTAAPPSPLQQTVNTVSQSVSAFASSSAPTITQAAQTIYNTVNTVRQAGLNYLNAQVVTSAPGEVLGASTEHMPNTTVTHDSVWQTIAGVLLPIFNSPMLFFCIFVFLVIFMCWLLWWAIRRFAMRRPNRY